MEADRSRAIPLPLLLSVPHAGLRIPPEAAPFCTLSPEAIAEDGDVGAAEIYTLHHQVERYLTADVARAIVDLNRAPDDRRKDGVVKTHTCWEVPVYDPFPPEPVVDRLMTAYYHPYHARLTEFAGQQMLAVDCHTMAAIGPPVGPDPGAARPRVCLSNADGTCPDEWLTALADCFAEQFGPHVSVNDPFQGGYITRTHGTEMPWVQLELSRDPFASNVEKREGVLNALRTWVSRQPR